MGSTKKTITLYCVILAVLVAAVIVSGCLADVDGGGNSRGLGYIPWEWPFGPEQNWYEYDPMREGIAWFYPFASEEVYYETYNSVIKWRDATFDDLGTWYVKFNPLGWTSICAPTEKISEDWWTKTRPLHNEHGEVIRNQRYDDEQERWVIYEAKYFF